MHRFRKSPPKGLTLIELVVVVAILAVLAGLIVPRVDFVKRSADVSSSASNMGELLSNLQFYRTVKDVYPDRFDSLLDSVAATSMYSKIFGHPAEKFESTAIPAYSPADQRSLSLLHLVGSTVMDHVDAAAYPSDSGTVARTIDTNGFNIATVKAGSTIELSIYPAGKPAGVTLVALGVGPQCSLNGQTMLAPPIYGGLDPEQYYGRFIAIYAVFTSGKRTELKAVVDPAGAVLNTRMKEYYQNQPD